MGSRTPIEGWPARFWVNVTPAGDDDCWLWEGRLSGTGYARIVYDGKQHQGHRIAYELEVGPIPAGLTIDHLCRNRACVNPRHLEPVTLAENVRRGESPSAVNARRTECQRGHPFDEENTGRSKKGRFCLACSRRYGREKMRRYRAAKKAKS